MRIIGVDPGGSGALALLNGPDLEAVADMPVFAVTRGNGIKRELDVYGLVDLLASWNPNVVFFEKVGGQTGESASAAFNFGRITGAAEAVCKTLEVRFEDVAPHVWKKHMRLTGKAKDDARLLATNRWQSHAAAFRRKMDDGRAEAALLADYGRQMLMREGIFG